MERKWYQQTWAIVALLWLFFPVGLYLMWRHALWSRQIKWGISAVTGLLLVVVVVLGSVGGNGDDADEVTGDETPSPQTATSTADPETSPTQAATEAPTEAPTQEPSPTQGLPELTTAECTYLNTFRDQLETIGSAMAEFGDLFVAPELFSDEWIIDVAIQLAILRLAYDDATALDPPQSLAAVHGSYISAITKLNDATFLIAEGIDNIDADSINEAANLMVEATADINTGTDQIAGFAATRSGSC